MTLRLNASTPQTSEVLSAVLILILEFANIMLIQLEYLMKILISRG